MTQKCENGCGKDAVHLTKSGKWQCDTHHMRCTEIQARLKATSMERYGVENASSSAAIKDLRKKIMLEKYGVENPSHLSTVKNKISDRATARWRGIFTELIAHDSTEQTMTQRQYNKLVTRVTDWMYREHKSILDPDSLRGKGWHIDHRVSKLEGYLKGIPAQVIGDISNLILLEASENMSKAHHSSLSVEALYEAYNHRYALNVSVPTIHTLRRSPPRGLILHASSDVCVHCGETAHYRSEVSGKWYCQSSANKCPTLRVRNGEAQLHSETKKIATERRVKIRRDPCQ